MLSVSLQLAPSSIILNGMLIFQPVYTWLKHNVSTVEIKCLCLDLTINYLQNLQEYITVDKVILVCVKEGRTSNA